VNKNFPDVKFHCPQIASTPKKAIEQLDSFFNASPNESWCLIGSSLGGYFSTYLSEKFNVKAVLVNPAIKPYELLTEYTGTQVNPYTNEAYTVETSYLNDLLAIEQQKIVKNNYLVMVQTGDEVLDYQQAADKFKHARLIVQPGGDHSFVNYEDMLPQIAEFLQLTSKQMA
jgi:predicted esterase YcpF (UPF0227 family)